jgi:hypothetical protein
MEDDSLVSWDGFIASYMCKFYIYFIKENYKVVTVIWFRPLHRNRQWSIVLPLLINPLLILHFEWKDLAEAC